MAVAVDRCRVWVEVGGGMITRTVLGRLGSVVGVAQVEGRVERRRV